MTMRIPPRPCSEAARLMVKPEGIADYRQEINGFERTWQEFVPSGYDGSQPVPLVLSVHGGHLHNADRDTAWALAAEREGFIVLFPHSVVEGITWNVWNDYGREDGMPDDVKYLDFLIDLMQKKYNIDPQRIYIQGQSMGDMMTTTYIFQRGDIFAAAAPLSGPQGPSRFFNADGSEKLAPKFRLPVIRTHGTEDLGVSFGKRKLQNEFERIKREEAAAPRRERRPEDVPVETRREKYIDNQLVNIYLWRKKNGCAELPELSMTGRYNAVSYRGEPCDMVYYIVERGEHGPYLDMADNLWTYFFTGYRRVDGEIRRVSPDRRYEADRNAVAVADGASFAYVDNRLVPIDPARPELTARELNGVWYVPASFIAAAVPGAAVAFSDGGAAAVITAAGKTHHLDMCNRVTVLNGYLRDLDRTLWLDEALYVPLGGVLGLLTGQRLTAQYGAAYLNEGGGEMSYDFAYIIRELLGVEKRLTVPELLEYERALVERTKKDGARGSWGA